MDKGTRLSFQKLGNKLALGTSINLPLGFLMAALSRLALKFYYPNSDQRLTHYYNAALLCFSLGIVVMLATVIEIFIVLFGLRCYKRVIETVVMMSRVFACLAGVTGASTMIIAHACRDISREAAVRQCVKQMNVAMIDNVALVRLKEACEAVFYDYLTICGFFTLVVALKFWVDKCYSMTILDEVRQLEDRDSARFYEGVVNFANVDDTNP